MKTAGKPSLRAVLIGAGRMGLTHVALFNLLTGFGIRWIIVEPSLLMRFGMRRALPRHLVEHCGGRFDKRWGRFDLAVIATPTTHHASAYAQVSAAATKVFVEKPLAVRQPTSHTMCGYVLLHHPLHQEVKQRVRAAGLTSLNVSLRANTVLTANSGWRGVAKQGGGVVNEFGSHTLSLLIDLVGPLAEIGIERAEVIHSVDAPDRAAIAGTAASGVPFRIDLDWTDASVRKPTYEVEAVLTDGRTVSNDFYEIHDGATSHSVADAPTSLDSYLRGVEFTNQAKHFLAHDDFSELLAVATEVDRVLGDLSAHTG